MIAGGGPMADQMTNRPQGFVTPMDDVKLIPARRLTRPRLAALFNAAYTDYLMPVRLNQGSMHRYLADNDIDLTVSRVALASVPVAFALIGRRGREAWLGGLGTVPEFRRRGVAARTLEAGLQTAVEDGAETVRLEVLEQNQPAVRLYERFGFGVTRRLIVCALRDLGPPRAESRPVRVDDARRWIAEQRVSREPWQRDDPVLARMADSGRVLAAIGVRDRDELAAVLICTGGTDRTSIMQMAARDDAAAADGLRGAAAAAGEPIQLMNFPADEPVAGALASLGACPDHVQLEMELRIGTGRG